MTVVARRHFDAGRAARPGRERVDRKGVLRVDRLVTGAQEFDLGLVGADERIVRELRDGWVVNVRVVKTDEIED